MGACRVTMRARQATTPARHQDDAAVPGGDALDPSTTWPEGRSALHQYCAVCHGPDAAGGAVYPGSIQGKTGIYPIIHAGRGAMPPIAALDEGDAADIEAWLASLVEGPPEGLTPQEIFGLTCAGCHGAAGEHGPGAADPEPRRALRHLGGAPGRQRRISQSPCRFTARTSWPSTSWMAS
ncbi:MAG: c-type cytochrome [bacterium]